MYCTLCSCRYGLLSRDWNSDFIKPGAQENPVILENPKPRFKLPINLGLVLLGVCKFLHSVSLITDHVMVNAFLTSYQLQNDPTPALAQLFCLLGAQPFKLCHPSDTIIKCLVVSLAFHQSARFETFASHAFQFSVTQWQLTAAVLLFHSFVHSLFTHKTER